jgi:hypothetical protein
MGTQNLHGARYVTLHNGLVYVWKGGSTIGIYNEGDLSEVDCFSICPAPIEWDDAHDEITQWIDNQEEQDHIEEMEYRETQEEARSAWLAS